MKIGLLMFASAGLALAQISAQSPVTCTANVGFARDVRSEGKTELVADVVLTCNGGFPTGPQVKIPAVTFTLTFNAAVTSRIIGANNASEALLLLDEPSPGVPPEVPNSQFPCLTGVCTAIGNSVGFGYYGPPPLNPNVFQGVVTAGKAGLNTIVWPSVPVDPPGPEGTRTFRFTNLRLDATGGQPLQVAVSNDGGIPVAGAALTVGTPVASFAAAVRDGTSRNAVPNGVPVTLAANGDPVARIATVRFADLFAGAFKPQTIAFTTGSGDTPPTPVAQNFPGDVLNSESGFYSPAFPTNTTGGNLAIAGLAGWGTRLMATFTNIPPGVTVYVGLRNDNAVINAPLARLVNTDVSGAGAYVSIPGNGTFAQLTPAAGTATAVWEVLSNNQGELLDLYDFGVYLSSGPNIFPAPSPINVTMRYAPFAGAGVPIFGGTPVTQPLATFTTTATPPPPPPPVLSVAPSSLTFIGTAGGQNPPAQTLSIGGSPTSIGYSIFSTGALPLRFQTNGGVTPDVASVTVNTRGIPAGKYTDTITVFAAGPSGSIPVAVTLILAPGPVITSLTPPSALAGSPAFTLVAAGANFTRTTSLVWNGAALTTTFVSSAQLTAPIAASLVATAGQASVTAVTADGASSNSVNFPIIAFTLTSINPSSVVAGGPDFTLTATGTGFATGATLNVGGTSLKPSSGSATQLTVTVPAATIAQAGALAVTVSNPGGQVSNPVTLTVTPGIILTSISPNTVTATAPTFVMNLTGSGFAAGASVQIGGTSLTPSSVSPTQIAVSVPAAVIAQAGTLPVRVANPGNFVSNSLNLTVNPGPRITALTPSTSLAGSPAFAMTVTGTNLTNGSTVQWDGQGLATTFVSTTQLTAQVPAVLVAAAGTPSVSAVTADGVSSNSLPFTVTPGPAITSLNPASANVASAAFTLTVTGTNLPQGSQVVFNGQTLSTTFVSATQLTAQAPASLLTTAGTASVTVVTPGGVSTNALRFTIALPPPPSVTVTAPSTATSGQNQTITLSLGGTYPVDLVGTLTLTFTGDTGLPDDPAIQFQNGRRVITFTVPAGTQPQIPPAILQTGTVAGVITVTLTFTTSGGADVTPGAPAQRIQVGRAAPTISLVTCTRNATGFTVVVDGYTNTREATQATFDFTAATGASLGTSELVVTAGSVFGSWFGNTAAAGVGGLFRYTQPFTVQGSPTSVAGLSVKLGNSAGTSPAASCQLQ